MASLIVGGVTIPVAISSPAWNRFDAVDRGRLFDGTFFASESGGATRDWNFSTTPVTQADADTYIAALSSPAAKLCSGDILQIPTMCSPELPSGKPTRAASSNRVILDFILHESQPSKVLFRYAPGDTITGESFSRSTVGDYLNGNISPPLSQAAINVKRDAHYINSVRSILLEAGSTNNVFKGNDWSDAAWSKTNITPATGIADPIGGTAGVTLTATAGNGNAFQNAGAGASIVRTSSIWIKRRTGTGSVFLIGPDGVNSPVLAVTAQWTRFARTGAANVNRFVGIQLATSADAVDVWDPQVDDLAFATSEMPTTTSAVTRGADSYAMPFTAPPVEMTVYLKFVEKGSALISANLFAITDAAVGNPLFRCLTSGGFYVTQHVNAANVSSQVPVAALGDVVELVLRLFGDGSVDISESINGGAVVVGTQSAPTALATAWADDILWLNSAGSGGVGFTALQSLKVIAGARGLAEARAA